MEKILHLAVVTMSIALVGNVYGQKETPKEASSMTVEAQLCTDVPAGVDGQLGSEGGGCPGKCFESRVIYRRIQREGQAGRKS
jgi:hypothetical protein